jgi:hypothetical protein
MCNILWLLVAVARHMTMLAGVALEVIEQTVLI